VIRRQNKVKRYTVCGVDYTMAELVQLSGDPTADPRLLEVLAKGHCTMEIYSRVAQNPALPIDALVGCIVHCTTEVLQNPAFRLHLVACPDSLDQLPTRERSAIAGCPAADPRLIRTLAASRSRPVRIRAEAALNPSTPVDMLVSFVRHDWRVRANLAFNPSMPVELQAVLASDAKPEVQCNLATRHDLQDETIELLLSSSVSGVEECLVRNRSIPESVRQYIYERAGIANPNTGAERWRSRNARMVRTYR